MNYYKQALEAAGAIVTDFQEFGDYQGTWLAVLDDGRVVEGSYGSCSGCDALLGEFDFKAHEHGDSDYYDPLHDGPKDGCEECVEFQRKFKEFGEGYILAAVSREQLAGIYEKRCADEYCTDDEKEILTWLRKGNAK